MTKNNRTIAKTAFGFVLVIGIVNFFADMTYEGARSITGPFLGSLGASATLVGVVAGPGEHYVPLVYIDNVHFLGVLLLIQSF